MKKPLLHHLQDYFFPHPRNNHRPHFFSAASVAALVALVLFFEGAYLLQTKFVFLKTDFLASVLPGALVSLTNQDRTALGLSGVTEDPLLSAAAQAAAEDMAAKGYFAHVSPDGKAPWHWLDQVGYRYSYAGQNLAVNFTDSANVESAWMESPTHRANIVKPQYTQVGFGTANGVYEGQETTFVVEFLATPRAEAAKVAAAVPAKAPPVAAAPIPTTSVQVLGTETKETAPAPSWFARLVASPLQTVTTILTALFALIAIVFSIAIFMRGRFQHPSVVLGGSGLILLVSGALLISALVAGSPVIFPADGEAASAFMALP
jgi:hypothetical protein